MAPVLAPILLVDLELSEPMPDASARGDLDGYENVRVLVRIHGTPLGVLQLPVKRYGDADVLAVEIEAAFGSDIDQHLDEDGVARSEVAFRGFAGDVSDAPPRCQEQAMPEDLVSVVIPTVGRDSLRECVLSILASTHRNVEVIVVDNAPWNTLGCDLVRRLQADDSRVRYEVEPMSGGSRARNRGLRAAHGSIVAFTDDDVVVDALWLQSLVRGLRRTDRVAAVTGLTMPLRLETPAEIAFEQGGGFGRGFRQRLWDLDAHRGASVLYPYTGLSGASSNNLAVVKDTLMSHGGFDERLGPATPTYASEDTDVVLSMLLAGHQISYEPTALVRHAHRREWDAFKWQVFTYSVGKTALLTKWAISDRKSALFLLRQIPTVLSKAAQGARHTFASGRKNATRSAHPSEHPPDLALLKGLGILYGPLAYARSGLARSDRSFLRFPIEIAAGTYRAITTHMASDRAV